MNRINRIVEFRGLIEHQETRYDVTLNIRVDELITMLGRQAARNKSGRSIECGGLVVTRAARVK